MELFETYNRELEVINLGENFGGLKITEFKFQNYL